MCSPRIRRRKPRRARPFGRLPPSCAGASAYDPAEVGRPPWAGGGAVVPAQHHSPLFLLVANPGGGRGLMGGLPITGTPGGWAGTPRRPGPQGANLRPREGQTLVTSSRGRPPPGRPAAPGPAPRRSRSPSATGRCSASGSPACPWRRSPPPCRIPPQSVLCGGGGSNQHTTNAQRTVAVLKAQLQSFRRSQPLHSVWGVQLCGAEAAKSPNPRR